ncbi:hypothetical protein TNCV_4400241 [Trichonephila clavipes]|nr:hypothetical protein TNCV_4400241 [Trichonephila clavipes]
MVTAKLRYEYYQVQLPDRQMLDHRFFQRLHRQLCETRSFHVTRYDAGRQRAVYCKSLEGNILRIEAVRPESNTRAVDHYESVSHESHVCRVLNENCLHLFRFQRVQALDSCRLRNVFCSWI